MARCLLAPSESLRLCFRSDLPGRWTLGESVAVTISLESEAGVRVRYPHSHQVWTEQESALAHEGLATGVPVEVVLGGDRAGRFLLDVASCIERGRGRDSGSSCGGVGCDSELTLDLSTGTAKGWVTIVPASSTTEPPTPPEKEEQQQQQQMGVLASCLSGEDSQRRGQWRPWAPAGLEPDGCEVQGGVMGGEGEGGVHLSISLPRAWAQAFNRPVLPLESLPALVVRPAPPPARCSSPTPVLALPSPPNPISSPFQARCEEGQTRGGAAVCSSAHSLLIRDGACSVRRVRFEVRNNGDRGRRLRALEAKRGEDDDDDACVSAAAVLATAVKLRDKEGCVGLRKALTSPSTTASSSPSPSRSPLLPGDWGAAHRPRSFHSSSSSSSSSSGGGGGSSNTGTSTSGGRTESSRSRNDDGDETSSTTVEVFAIESVALGGFFGTLWDCSLEMGAFLASLGPEAMAGKRVVELGAGCGAVSILCAALGASEVVATEAEDVLPLLALNLERNERRGFLNIKACEYNWGLPIEDHPALARGNFDVVVLSDLLYDPAAWEPLLNSLRQLTTKKNEQRADQRRRPRPSSLAAAGTPVVYLAHRTRNAQEHQFFDALVCAEAEETAAAAFEETSSSNEEEQQQDDGTEVLSFRYRKLSNSAGGGEKKQGFETSDSSVRRECRAREGEADRGLRWARGCFSDVALYELSPIASDAR